MSQKALFNCFAKSVELNNGDLSAVCLKFLLILVNIELVLRTILSLFNSQIKLPLDKDREELEA